ncbi:HAD-IC family P-type ATPase [Baekduia soli]|uniref:HAD-IC family P-type ATPase n=1 Tax=Baekduia soli TaxID=496014 RepID=A0A5B8UC07_9ACTN|nr:HAD-IC family P-type ATPase [Baekduia soli]
MYKQIYDPVIRTVSSAAQPARRSRTGPRRRAAPGRRSPRRRCRPCSTGRTCRGPRPATRRRSSTGCRRSAGCRPPGSRCRRSAAVPSHQVRIHEGSLASTPGVEPSVPLSPCPTGHARPGRRPRTRATGRDGIEDPGRNLAGGRGSPRLPRGSARQRRGRPRRGFRSPSGGRDGRRCVRSVPDHMPAPAPGPTATPPGGLDAREAARRLLQYGPNEIRRESGPRWWRSLLGQFTHPLALLLWAAAALSLATGVLALAVAIVVVIVLNAAFAFAQERQAQHATEALRELLPPRARVRRGGALVEIEATGLVPGDLLLLAEGDRLSADARLTAGAVEVDMSPLTGESRPVTRSADGDADGPVPDSPLAAPDRVFAGTLCTGGDAHAVVVATAMHTQLGRIAALSQAVAEESSPLQRQVNRAAQLIAGVAVGLGITFFAVGHVVAGLSLSDAGVFAIGLLVANVPEGLLPTITLALAVGVRRMARRHALVKKLTAVETLGSTDVICTDKTGTLTQGRMTATSLWQGGRTVAIGAGTPAATGAVADLLRSAVLCNNATLTAVPGGGWARSGDPSESALLLAAAALGVDVPALQAGRETWRRRLFAFDARLKRMATLDVEPGSEPWIHARAPRWSCWRAAPPCGTPTGRGARWTPRGPPACARRSSATPPTACACSASPTGPPPTSRSTTPTTATPQRPACASPGSSRCATRCVSTCPPPWPTATGRASASSSSPATTA